MRQKGARPKAFQGPAAVRGTPTGQVYVFGRGGADSGGSSEEEAPQVALRPRRPEKPAQRPAPPGAGSIVLLQRELARDDSLNRLALQYGCQVRPRGAWPPLPAAGGWGGPAAALLSGAGTSPPVGSAVRVGVPAGGLSRFCKIPLLFPVRPSRFCNLLSFGAHCI